MARAGATGASSTSHVVWSWPLARSRHSAEEPGAVPSPAAGSVLAFYQTTNLGRDTRMANQGYSKRTISVEHVTIRSSNSFDVVRAKLAGLVPRIDDGIFTLVRYGEGERALRELEASPRCRSSARDHGALLGIAGLRRRAVQYDIGNPLTL